MGLSVQDWEANLRATSCTRDFIGVCREITEASQNIRIDREAVSAYAKSIFPPKFIPGWEEYLTPGQSIENDFIELAISTSINSGYLYQGADGKTAKWEIGGSGAKALLSKMDEARASSFLPILNLQSAQEVEEKLGQFFNGLPYAATRLQIWKELAEPTAVSELKAIFRDAALPGGAGYHFTFDHLRAMGKVSPTGFGEDPLMKKAVLVPILFAGVAHNKIAANCVTIDGPIASDYRLPQTQGNTGMIRFSDELVRRLDAEELFTDLSLILLETRAAAIPNSADVLTECKVPGYRLQHLDGDYWFAGRLFDADPSTLDEKKAKIRKALEAIGANSGFAEPGFMNKTAKPIAPESMRI